MKPCGFSDSALLCRGPIQNSLTHFTPPPQTTQRLRNSSTCRSTSCRKAYRSRNGFDWQPFGSQPKGWPISHLNFRKNAGLLHKLGPARQLEKAKDYYVFITGGQERKSAVCMRLKKEDLAPRARFELATLRLTAERPTSLELAGDGTNRRKSASCD